MGEKQNCEFQSHRDSVAVNGVIFQITYVQYIEVLHYDRALRIGMKTLPLFAGSDNSGPRYGFGPRYTFEAMSQVSGGRGCMEYVLD